jgi:phage-related protein
MSLKPLVWIGDSLDRVRTFAAAARKKTGFELWEIQQGKPPTDWKPLSPVGPGSHERRQSLTWTWRAIDSGL